MAFGRSEGKTFGGYWLSALVEGRAHIEQRKIILRKESWFGCVLDQKELLEQNVDWALGSGMYRMSARRLQASEADEQIDAEVLRTKLGERMGGIRRSRLNRGTAFMYVWYAWVRLRAVCS